MARFVSLEHCARHIGKSERSIRNCIGEGHFKVYKRRGQRSYLVDLDEVDAWLATSPPGIHGRVPFGPQARVVELPPQARSIEPR